jgi:subtilisin-like proprotein convertase family protein
VQEVLIRTATQTDPTNNEWRTNKAGFKFNPNFGAGRVNAGAAVALATNWANLPAMTSTASEQASLNVAVPDNDSNGITRSFDLSASNLRVEQAVVTVDITHANRGDLVINLVSPSGTVSPLAELHGDTNANYTAMTFRSTFNWGEDSKGTWQVQISDRRAANTGTLTRVKLDVFGTTPSAPTLLAKTVGSGQFTLGVAGTPALAYTLQYNTNATVTNWTTLFSTNAPASAFDLIDASASGPRRFYRLVR